MSAPAHLGRYLLRRRIGAGGFATVWLAYDEQLDSPVAIKVLADNWAADYHVRHRFVEEGRFLRKVESPHVVPVYDAGELEDGRPFLVMAYADQGNLTDRLQDAPLPLAQAATVIRHVGRGLDALHQRGVLHRDVKPGNVLFRTVDTPGDRVGDRPGDPVATDGGQVRAMVGDLGLGKALEQSSRLTMIAGTPAYVAPEQARGEALDPRSDLFSLAALSYLLLTGRPAYSHSTLMAAAMPGAPPSLGPGWPAELDAALPRGMAAERADRQAGVAEFLAECSAALATLRGSAGPDSVARIPSDPHLTIPGHRPSPPPAPPAVESRSAGSEPSGGAAWGTGSSGTAASERRLPSTARVAEAAGAAPARPRRTWASIALLVLLAVLVTGGGAVAGALIQERYPEQLTVSDDEGSLSVTVPRAWDRLRSTAPWTPPEQVGEQPALSLGTAEDWQLQPGEEGVFLGVLAARGLPRRVPQHPECESAGDPVTDEVDGGASVTVVYSGCPGYLVERVVRVAANRILWIQVRVDDRATANRVLDSVETHGM